MIVKKCVKRSRNMQKANEREALGKTAGVETGEVSEEHKTVANCQKKTAKEFVINCLS